MIVSGVVQGSGFWPFIHRIAVSNGSVGFMRNRGDAGVEIVVEGKENHVRVFLKDSRVKPIP